MTTTDEGVSGVETLTVRADGGRLDVGPFGTLAALAEFESQFVTDRFKFVSVYSGDDPDWPTFWLRFGDA